MNGPAELAAAFARVTRGASMRTMTAFPLERAWAMEEGRLATLTRAIESALSADREGLAEIRQTLSMTRREARAGAKSESGYTVENGVAHIPFQGVVTKTPTCFGAFFGGDAVTSDFVDAVNAAVADESVREIVEHFDSPGGSVDGTAEAADANWAARQKKPVTAYVDGMAASAAYWIASQATRVVVNNATARVGSIGVYAVIPDTSRAYENRGVRVHVVKAGDAKGGGVTGAPVTPDVLAEVQREVSALYDEFVSAVARGRGISLEKARALADGRVHIGRAAMDLGLVDGIASLEEAMAGMTPLMTEGTTSPEPVANNTRAGEVAPTLRAHEEEDTMSDTPPNLESRLEALEKARAEADEKAAQADAEIAALKAENEALKAKAEATASTVATVTSDRDADRLVADLKGENGGPVRLAAQDDDGEKVVRDRVAAKGADEARAYFTQTLAVLGKGEGSVVTSAQGKTVPSARNHFDAFGPAKWQGSADPVMQAYGRKIEWIDAAEKSGRKFRTAAEAFAAYDAAHKSAA